MVPIGYTHVVGVIMNKALIKAHLSAKLVMVLVDCSRARHGIPLNTVTKGDVEYF